MGSVGSQQVPEGHAGGEVTELSSHQVLGLGQRRVDCCAVAAPGSPCLARTPTRPNSALALGVRGPCWPLAHPITGASPSHPSLLTPSCEHTCAAPGPGVFQSCTAGRNF